MQKILVTGGTGLVGSAIKSISSDYSNFIFHFVSSKSCDLTNFEQTKKLFEDIHPDFVIHLAANVGGLFKNMNQKVEMLEKNILMNFNIVQLSHLFKVKKLICCLSTCIFPDKTTYPINESMLHNGPPHSSNDAYAYAKRMLEIHCQTYRENYNDNFVCIIPTNVYGEHDNFHLEDAHVIPALIHKCFLAKQNNEKFIVKGTGKPLRQFIYSKDLEKLIMWTLLNYNEKNIILSTSEKDEVSIEHVAKLIATEFDYLNNLMFDSSFSDGQFKKTADNSNLINSLNEEFHFMPIDLGIHETVQWFLKNYAVLRK